MKKIISLLLVALLSVGFTIAEESSADQNSFTVEQQAFDAYLDIAFVYDEGVKYLEELGVLWSKVTDTDSVDDIHQLWFNTYLTGNISGTGFSRFSNLNELATVKYGYKGAEELSSYLNGLRDKTDAIWICLSLLVESGYIEDPNDLESYLDDAMEGIRSVMTLDREYPFLKDLQNYYKDANYLYEYAADFNDSYVSFNEKLDEFQKNRSSWEIDFEFIYDKNADEFDYVYEVRREEAAHERELVFARASALENNGDLEGALDLYWSIRSTADVERCRSKLNEATSDEMEKNYLRAVAFEESGDYASALKIYQELNDYKDCAQRLEVCKSNLEPVENVTSFSEGLAPVKKGGKWGYIDLNGRNVIACEFDSAGSFNGGLALVKKNNKYGYIDTNGNVTIPFEWDLAYSFTDGYAIVENSSYAGLIDTNGNKAIVPGDWEKVWMYSEGLVKVQKGGKWGFATLEGELVIDCVWDLTSTFSEGLALVSKDGKYGYIDATGNEIIPCQWKQAGSFHSGLAYVENYDSQRAYIDYYGNIVHPFGKLDFGGNCEDGVFCNYIVGKAGCYDLNGNVLIDPVYDNAAYGEGYFALLKDGKVTILFRDEVQPGWQEEMAAYEADLAAKREAIAAEAERQKMLKEYTDKETVKKAQAALNEAGYPCGTPDGAAGKKTIAALTQYQTDKGLTVTGTITHETLISIGLAS